jgi:hypothetical protein
MFCAASHSNHRQLLLLCDEIMDVLRERLQHHILIIGNFLIESAKPQAALSEAVFDVLGACTLVPNHCLCV